MSEAFSDDDLDGWCIEHLGARPEDRVFEAGHLSKVLGLRLADGTDVVVKIRPPAARLITCWAVQDHLRRRGYPCPEPLVAPVPFGSFTASAERLVEGGELRRRDDASPEDFALALASLVSLSPAVAEVGDLDPSPPWVSADLTRPGRWPPPDGMPVDLNTVHGPEWVDQIGVAVQERLVGVEDPPVVGHGDFYSGNVRWLDDDLHMVHDWDSVVAEPEVVVAGVAAAVFPATGGPGEEATVEESERFLVEYVRARRLHWTSHRWESAWAAGLWTRVFDCKKQFADHGSIEALTVDEAKERAVRAGIIRL